MKIYDIEYASGKHPEIKEEIGLLTVHFGSNGKTTSAQLAFRLELPADEFVAQFTSLGQNIAETVKAMEKPPVLSS